MTRLTLTPPATGEPNTAADPKIVTALQAIEAWANGNVGTGNITALSVTEGMLEAALSTKIGAKLSGLTIVPKTSESYTAKNGELVEMLGTGGFTVTLPAATANVIVGVASPLVESKVKTAGGAIIGDGHSTATLTLAAGQHVVLQADGVNWLITSGIIPEVLPGAWQALTLEAAHIEAVAGQTPGARLENNGTTVRLRGSIEEIPGKSQSTGESPFTLPASCRPAFVVHLYSYTSNFSGVIKLDVPANTGVVTWGHEAPEKTVTVLDGLTFNFT
jgi:hypothetical protein